jgi:hypothetical protein
VPIVQGWDYEGGLDRRLAVGPYGEVLTNGLTVTWESLFDYGTRTDNRPIYLGRAPMGTQQSDPRWLIHRFDWEDLASGTSRITRIRSRVDAWTNRTTGWS